MQRILFVFLDGVGLGAAGPKNPLSQHLGDALRQLAEDNPWTADLSPVSTPSALVRPIDPTLGVDGLPQSGTGQATLFTGINCAQRVGRHFGPFPHSATHDVIDDQNIFHRVKALFPGSSPAAFANAFPPQFFSASRRRWTVTTRCCAGADVPLRDLTALRETRAVTADLTADAWRTQLHIDVPRRTEAEAAEHLFQTHRTHRLTLFEYFATDKVGHDRIDRSASSVLKSLERFFSRLLERLDPTVDTLLVTSDHGNLEDMGHTQHTRNPVPLIVRGWAAPYFSEAESLTDVTPGVIDALHHAIEAESSASVSPDH